MSRAWTDSAPFPPSLVGAAHRSVLSVAPVGSLSVAARTAFPHAKSLCPTPSVDAVGKHRSPEGALADLDSSTVPALSDDDSPCARGDAASLGSLSEIAAVPE